MEKQFFVGVSGFSYPKWKGSFYPKDLKNEKFLEYYAGKLNSVEINSSFYAPPSNVMVKSWNSRTPENFRFAFKAPRQITHILKLGNGAVEATGRLDKTIQQLDMKQGPILFQLPPFFKIDLTILEHFLTGTSSIKKKVFEFRHESWLNNSTYNLLEKYDTGFCVAETEDMKPIFKTTSIIAYFRLRNDTYDQEQVDDWARKINELTEKTSETYVYLRHDETGNNAVLAEKMRDRLR
jgi:uncharacterized protein YecE (DUF72 family)